MRKLSNEDERQVRAVENRTALSKAITVQVEDPETFELAQHAFRKFGQFAGHKGATTTAAEMTALGTTKHDWRFGNAVIRLNSVGMVIACGFALMGLADFLAEAGARQQAKGLAEIFDKINKQIPDDWDCGDPDCEACAKHHGRVRAGIRL